MKKFNKIFKTKKPIIAMIHVRALPGTPKYDGEIKKVIEQALAEAKIYRDAGVDALAIENMHDIPYLNQNVDAEITAGMSIIGYEVKRATNLPCGIQILAGANKQAIAVALAAGLDFVRVEGYVFAHVADEGIFQSCAGELLRYQKKIGAEHIAIFTDIKKKHSSHAITNDVDIVETAKTAEFFLSDGVIITGISTGASADLGELKKTKTSINIPVLVGSGITYDNVQSYLSFADGLIVGSYFKRNGYWANEVIKDRVKRFMEKVNSFRLDNL